MLKQITKIIATLGPSLTHNIWSWEDYRDVKNVAKITAAKENIAAAIKNGVNVFRFNFSHGNHEEQEIRLLMLKEVIAELKVNISLLLDTKGPEIRVGEIFGEGIVINEGSLLTIKCLEQISGTLNSFSVTDSTKTYNMALDVEVGHQILVDDGKLILLAIKVDKENGIITVKAMNSHCLKKNKRINLPSANYSIPFLSKKDISDIEFAIKHKFHYLAASFVNTAANIHEIKKILDITTNNLKIIAKIETQQSLKNYPEILEVVDGIMIARGDLGLETQYSLVPYHAQRMIYLANLAHKPIIMATQMLDSMEHNLMPTRAEVSDIYWANVLGVDATMLSGETAQGQYPIEAIKVMAEINQYAALDFQNHNIVQHHFKSKRLQQLTKKINLWQQPINLHNQLFDINNLTESTTLIDQWWPRRIKEVNQILFFVTTELAEIKSLAASRPKISILVPITSAELAAELALFNSIHPIVVTKIPKTFEECSKILQTQQLSTESQVHIYLDEQITTFK